MANGPSFTNLDQSNIQESNLNLQDKITTKMNSIQSSTVLDTQSAIKEIQDSIKSLEDFANRTDIMGSMKEQLTQTKKMFQELQQQAQMSMYEQTMDVEKFVSKLSGMNDAVKQAQDAVKQFNSVSIGDPQQLDEFLRRIDNMVNSFHNLTRTAPLINVKTEDLDDAKTKIMSFVNSVANESSQAFKLADGMISATQDPRVLDAFKQLFGSVNNMVGNIPEKLIASANINNSHAGGQAGNTADNSFQDLIKAIGTFTGTIQQQQQPVAQTPGLMSTDIRKAEVEHQQNVLNDANIESLNSKIDRITMSTKLANNADKEINNINKSAMDTESKLSEMLLKFQSGYSSKEKRNLKDSGFDDVKIKDSQSQIIEIQKLLNHYNSENSNLSGSVRKFNKQYSEAQGDPDGMSGENLQGLIDMANRIEEQTQATIKTLNEALGIASNLSDNLAIDPDKLKALPDDFKDAAKIIKDMLSSGNSSAQDLLKFTETFKVNTGEAGDKLNEALKESIGSVDKLSKSMGEIDSSSTDMITKITGGFSKALGFVKDISGSLGGITKFFSGIGIGVSANSLTDVFKGSTNYYKQFGQMDVNSSMAQMAQGSSGINQSVLDTNRETGMDLYYRTNGVIGLEDYSKTANDLVSNVQGHYGNKEGKEQGVSDMYEMAKPALEMQKLYGVDATNTIQTFYKELNLSASGTNKLMLDLANSALAANIPVSQYIKTVGSLGTKFKELGVNLNAAENGMRNLTTSGMSLDNASSMVSQTGNVMDRYASNTGEAMFYGMLGGVSSDPWQSARLAQDRWDANGNVKDGATDVITAGLDAKVNLLASVFGGSEDAQWIGLNQEFGNMGYGEKEAAQLTNAYQSGDKDLFSKLFDELPSSDEQQVTLKGQDDLEQKLIAAADKTDELTKAEIELQSIEQKLATVNQGILDVVGKSLTNIISTLGGTLLKLDKTIFGQFNALGESLNSIGSLIKGLIEHPILGVLTLIAGKLGVNTLLSKSTLTGTAAGVSAIKATAATGAGFGKTFGTALKVTGKTVPILGGIVDGGLTVAQGLGSGQTTGYSVSQGVGSGVGSGLGMWGGAAAGAALGSIIPGAGTLVGGAVGAIGGLAGGWLGGKIGKAAGGGTANLLGIEQYKESTESTKSTKSTKSTEPAINNSVLASPSSYTADFTPTNFSNTYDSDLSSYTNQFNSLAGYNPKTNENYINGISASSQGTEKLKLEQQVTNQRLEDLKSYQGNLTDKGNSIAQYSYSLQETKYGDMIDKAKTQLSQLTNIANIIDAGFTFLDKTLNQMTNLLTTIASNTKFSSSSNSSSTSNTSKGSTGDVSIDSMMNKDLKDKTDLTAEDINKWIASKAPITSKMQNTGEAFIKASQESGLDPLYLVSHAAQETGWGTSPILQGKNNWYGIGAFDSSPYQSAYGFNNSEAGIIEGAKWIAKNYVNAGQDSVYKMRNNNGVHQYATDENWDDAIASIMASGLSSTGKQSTSTQSKQKSVSIMDNVSTSTNASNGIGLASYETPTLLSDSDSSSTSTDYSNMRASAPIYAMGSPEYSNGTQSYNSDLFKDIPGDSYYTTDGQAMARSLYKANSSSLSAYSSVIDSYDDKSSSYNKSVSPNFKIDINVNGGDKTDYDAMAAEMQSALASIAQQYMGSSANIANVNYQRMLSQY